VLENDISHRTFMVKRIEQYRYFRLSTPSY
jgi:hypothetical protein